jgi:hypothetical protein
VEIAAGEVVEILDVVVGTPAGEELETRPMGIESHLRDLALAGVEVHLYGCFGVNRFEFRHWRFV